MRETWIVSDHHFGHERIIELAGRPFADVEEMNEELVRRHNAVVGKNDIVYHLGDVSWNNRGWDFAERLNGIFRLCLGNHDHITNQRMIKWASKVELFYKLPDKNLFLSHMPIVRSSLWNRKKNREFVNVHGHIHDEYPPTERHVNVCVEKTNYTPVHIDRFENFK